jgi:hypothetical protein
MGKESNALSLAEPQRAAKKNKSPFLKGTFLPLKTAL